MFVSGHMVIQNWGIKVRSTGHGAGREGFFVLLRVVTEVYRHEESYSRCFYLMRLYCYYCPYPFFLQILDTTQPIDISDHLFAASLSDDKTVGLLE